MGHSPHQCQGQGKLGGSGERHYRDGTLGARVLAGHTRCRPQAQDPKQEGAHPTAISWLLSAPHPWPGAGIMNPRPTE